MIEARVKTFLNTCSESQRWFEWVDVEKNIRPALLSFSLKDPQALFRRAQAWKFVGDQDRAIRLYQIFLTMGREDQTHAQALISLVALLYKKSEPKNAEKNLAQLLTQPKLLALGFNKETDELLHELALPPYSSARALKLYLHEMKQGRGQEDLLQNLVMWTKIVDAEDTPYLYQQIVGYVPKSQDDIDLMSTTLLDYGDKLRMKAEFAKAGDVFSVIGNLAGSRRQTEANYKAGIVYARAGQFAKAKTSWQLSANNVSDPSFSQLASERLKTLE